MTRKVKDDDVLRTSRNSREVLTNRGLDSLMRRLLVEQIADSTLVWMDAALKELAERSRVVACVSERRDGRVYVTINTHSNNMQHDRDRPLHKDKRQSNP